MFLVALSILSIFVFVSFLAMLYQLDAIEGKMEIVKTDLMGDLARINNKVNDIIRKGR